ncbi:MAG: 3'-5' exonuclease [Eubacteriales bacterium]|nr:3'-5' exonuclease [Eubacteriales bacterium]
MTDKEIFDQKYAALRRELIARDFERLNPEQREAVLHTEGPLLVLAGAGSGKTTVLINRIVNLIRYGRGASDKTAPEGAGNAELLELSREYAVPGTLDEETRRRLCAVDPVRPWNILAITFTNKAAGELKARLSLALGDAGADVWASTFHSTCARILRRDIGNLGLEPRFTIYDEDERLAVVKASLRELGIDEKVLVPREVSQEISRAKDALQDAEAYAKAPLRADYPGAQARKNDISRIYKLYEKKLRDNNALDFDDLILYTVKLLETCPDTLAYYQDKFRYVLVDEYQDTNPAQDRLTQLFASGHGNLCVVGDDDQSIYRFRGATVKNILEFDKIYPDAKVIRLEQNYRSTKTILTAANDVIRRNEARRGKELWTDNEDGEKIGFYCGRDERDEAQYIAAQVLAGYKKNATPKDFAVLYRMNAQSNAIERALSANGIPYRIVGGMRFFDRAEVRDVIAYLCAISNHDDTMRLRRIVNNPPRRISPERVESAMECAEENGISLYEVLRCAGSFNRFDRAAQPMETFAGLLEELRLAAETTPLDEFYDLVLEKTGYLDQYLRKAGDPESMVRAENVRELRSSIVEYMARAEAPTLSGFLEDVALFTDIDRFDSSADAVVLMTLHSAKGLEFPYVFLCGMEEGIFPSMRSASDPEAMEEERRLAYVGITRAKRKLYITCAETRMLFGHTSYNQRSRFIAEIPEGCIDMGPAREKKAPASRMRPARPERKPPVAPTVHMGASSAAIPAAPKPGARAVLFRTGDRISHSVFGAGTVSQTTPMGGDMLLTISFDSGETKKFLANAASRYITKLS